MPRARIWPSPIAIKVGFAPGLGRTAIQTERHMNLKRVLALTNMWWKKQVTRKMHIKKNEQANSSATYTFMLKSERLWYATKATWGLHKQTISSHSPLMHIACVCAHSQSSQAGKQHKNIFGILNKLELLRSVLPSQFQVIRVYY